LALPESSTAFPEVAVPEALSLPEVAAQAALALPESSTAFPAAVVPEASFREVAAQAASAHLSSDDDEVLHEAPSLQGAGVGG
jgi:hypothetical protein